MSSYSPMGRRRKHVNDHRDRSCPGRRLGVLDEATAEHDVRMRAAGAETPSTVHTVAALDFHRATVGRRLTGRHEVDIRVQLPRRVLIEPSGEESAVAADLHAPSRSGIGMRENLGELDLRGQRHLRPAPALREHHPEAAGGFELVDEVARQPALGGGLPGTRGDLGSKRAGVGQDLVGGQELAHLHSPWGLGAACRRHGAHRGTHLASPDVAGGTPQKERGYRTPSKPVDEHLSAPRV